MLHRHGTDEGGKEFRFPRAEAFLGPDDLGFVLLQLRSNKALGIRRGLFAAILVRHEVQIRLGDFDIISKDVIMSYFE